MTTFSRIGLRAAVIAALGVGAAVAQPATKLTTGLDTDTLETIWCSSLFYEASYWHDDGSDWAVYYEDLAYVIEDDLDDPLTVNGLGDAEITELWEIYDASALDLADTDGDTFTAQLGDCEAEFGALLPKPKS